jgi:hypothetical protein
MEIENRNYFDISNQNRIEILQFVNIWIEIEIENI